MMMLFCCLSDENQHDTCDKHSPAIEQGFWMVFSSPLKDTGNSTISSFKASGICIKGTARGERDSVSESTATP